jgi:hypothetical protein
MNATALSRLSPLVYETPPNAAERAQWLERYRRSGLTQRAFAEAQGLNLSRLRYWLYSPRPSSEAVVPAPRLQEIRVDGWPAANSWGAEVSLPDGRIIRLDAPLARELIAPLMAPR